MSKKKPSIAKDSNVKVMAIGGALVAVAAFVFVWKPQSASLSDAKRERREAEAQLAELQRPISAEEATATPTPEQETLDRSVPPTPALAELFRQLDAVAKETGMTQSAIAPANLAPNPKGSGGVVAVSLSATGPRDGAYAYVKRLSALERMIVVEQVSLTPSEGGVMGVQLSAKAFTTQAPAIAKAG